MLRAVLLLTFSSLLLVASCGGGSNSAGPPSGATSTVLVPEPFGAPADDAFLLEVRARATDASGRGISGRTIQFSVAGEASTLVPATAVTDVTGWATTNLRSSVAGTKTISAIISPASMMPVPITQTATATFVYPNPDGRFVRATGSDGNSGEHALDAWGTIGFALTQVQPGQTIYVGAGTYAENPVIDIAAPLGSPISVRADTTGEFTGDPGVVLLDAQGGDFGFQLSGAENCVIRGFTIANAAPLTDAGGAIWATGTTNFNYALLENQIRDNTRGITITNSNRFHVEGNVISNNLGSLGDGVTTTGSMNGIITRNLIYNNGGRGVSVNDATQSLFVSRNTLYMNAGVQVRAASGTTSQINDNIVSEGGSSGIVLDLGSFVLEKNNVLFGHPGNDFFSGAGNSLSGTSTIADPLLFDPAGADGLLGGAQSADDRFTLDTGSPAIDNGGANANATFIAFGGFLRSMTTSEAGTLDGEAPDGALSNIGFHARPIAYDPLPPLAAGDLRLTWAVDDNPKAFLAQRLAGSTTWEVPIAGTSANTDIVWVVSARSPSVPVEAYAALTDNGAFTNLFVRVWNGTRWSEEKFFNQLTSPIPSASATKRAFDLEFEGLSGDLMVVRGIETDIPVYRVWSNGSWTTDQPIYTSAPSGGKIRWIELAADPNSDRMCVVALDDNDFLTTSVWDGSAWDTDHTLLDVSIASQVARPFDVTFESLSGDIMVTWGYTGVVEEARFSTRASGATNWVAGLLASIDSLGAVVRLASDPISDRIVLGVSEGVLDDDVSGAIWNGNSWGDVAELEGLTGTAQGDLGIGWVGNTGRAILVYRGADGADSLDWARWRSTGWNVMPDFTVAGMNDPVLYQTVSDGTNGRLRVVLQDTSGQLFELSTDGTDWTVDNGGAPVATGLTGTGPNRPFGLVGRPGL